MSIQGEIAAQRKLLALGAEVADVVTPGEGTGTRMPHAHEFAVNASCECGVMLSALVRSQAAEIARLTAARDLARKVLAPEAR